MKSLTLLALVVGFSSQFAMAQYGICYGDSGCEGVKVDRPVSLAACKQMLIRENYEAGSWIPSKSNSCLEIAVAGNREAYGNDGVPALRPPADTINAKCNTGVGTPGNCTNVEGPQTPPASVIDPSIPARHR